MNTNAMKLVKESGAGKLYESNRFLVPVLTGQPTEMGKQYGALMSQHMEQAYGELVAPAVKGGAITDALVRATTDRICTTASIRYRQFYDGVVEGTGWSLEKVAMLDNLMEFSIFQAKTMNSFAGCTSIMSWNSHSSDGGMYIGRNEDWSETFTRFPQVLTIRRPTDGSYRTAAMGWPGVLFPMTALNEHGAYMDIHDGTSMGGSIIALERIPVTCLLSDLMAEVPSLDAMVRRFNTWMPSASLIFTLADETGGASMECSSLAGCRVRRADGDSMVVVNTHLDDSWGLGRRDSPTHSFSARLPNMTRLLGENAGKMNAQLTRDLMDMKLYDDNGKLLPNGGATKPVNHDEDVTVHQVVTDIKRRQMWLKVPVPSVYADWTQIDLPAVWN